MTQRPEDTVLVAFFGVRPTADKNGYIGAMLVIDALGVPKEFRCTQPIKPSPVQRALYGRGLETHIVVDLCGQPLLNALTTSPVACLTESRDSIDLGEGLGMPVFHIQRTQDVLTVDSDGNTEGSSLSLVGPTWSGSQQYSLATHPSWSPKLTAVASRLNEMCRRVDLLEPFERLTTAIETLIERDERFR